jgi:hypothetical protein
LTTVTGLLIVTELTAGIGDRSLDGMRAVAE